MADRLRQRILASPYGRLFGLYASQANFDVHPYGRPGIGSIEDLDAAMRFGCGYPMGPLQLLDLIGLDTAYEILDTMYKQGRDRLHAPAPILKQYVTAGLLGLIGVLAGWFPARDDASLCRSRSRRRSPGRRRATSGTIGRNARLTISSAMCSRACVRASSAPMFLRLS